MIQYSILHEDEELLVVNKLTPLPVQPEKTGTPSLQELLAEELRVREGRASKPFLEAAHRIDRRASGAVIFARTQKSLSTLEAAFRDRRIEKTYLACVENEPRPESGRLEHRIIWDKRTNRVRARPIGPEASPEPQSMAGAGGELSGTAAAAGKGGRRGNKAAGIEPGRAVLEYRLAGRSERYWFVEARLITGRHHQIRAQFSAAGFPIRGDLKYGARRSTANGLIMLHARRLVFTQPRTGETIEILAPFPEGEALWDAFPESRGIQGE